MTLYVLFKAKNLYDSWTRNGPANCHYNVTPNGWMDTEKFKDWFEHVFLVHVDKLEGPKLLYLDGHKSHIDMELSLLASRNNVSILCLPPHATHILQPLDVGVFKPVKTAWAKIVEEYYSKSNYDVVSKEVFGSLLKK